MLTQNSLLENSDNRHGIRGTQHERRRLESQQRGIRRLRFGLPADLLRLAEEMTDRFLGGVVFGLSSPRSALCVETG